MHAGCPMPPTTPQRDCRLAADPPRADRRAVLVLAAGTSDLPVAREAQLTASYLGRAPSSSSTSAWPGSTGSSPRSTLCARRG